MLNMQNKVAAITGAGSGIGRALALGLADEGCHLALADINESGLKQTAQLLASFNVTVTTTLLDVAKEQAVFDWADQVVADHGKVNLIFNNAGVALSGTVDGLSLADYRWIMDINFWGVVYGTKAFLPYLESAGEGHVINISSVAGLSAQPLMSGYNASKFAVRGFTESLRQDLELADSVVSATCVHPGGIRTNIAKNARQDASILAVTGQTIEEASKNFEQLFFTSAEDAAATILKAVKKNKRRVLIGPDAYGFDAIVRLAPTAYQRAFTGFVRARKHKA